MGNKKVPGDMYFVNALREVLGLDPISLGCTRARNVDRKSASRYHPAMQFTLPLRLAPLYNVAANMHWAKRHKIHRDAYVCMLAQHGRAKQPFAGKVKVTVLRCSSKRPDPDASWSKIPLDVLKADKHGLGYIKDDSSDDIELVLTWQHAPAKQGRVVVTVEPADG